MKLVFPIEAITTIAFVACVDQTRVSTSNYAIAGTFAAAAGAVQVAEMANRGGSATSCSAATCSGCCDLTDHCVRGTANDACGTGGSACVSCEQSGRSTCADGICSPSGGESSKGVAGTAQSLSSSYSSSVSSPPSPHPLCEQVVIVCFAAMHSMCDLDAAGCRRCTCVPDERIEWVLPHQ
jgi:hypothetical protein